MKRAPLTEKLLVLGIDGMDSRTARRLVDAGRMPNLASLLQRGCARDDLAQLGCIPTITPPCWTSLATGTYPGTHGITCYWRQAPESLDAVVYNLDSRNCEAEQLWNVTAEAGKKTLVWHWPGSSWPPSSDSPNLSVVDGTQPGSVNMGIAQMDWEKVVVADASVEQQVYAPRLDRPLCVGCIINDVEAIAGTQQDAPSRLDKPTGIGGIITDVAGVNAGVREGVVIGGDEDDEMMELWWGDGARSGGEIRTYVTCFEETEIYIGSKVAYDAVIAPLQPARGWESPAAAGALEFSITVASGAESRPALVLPDESGRFTRVAIFHDKTAAEPLVTLRPGQMSALVLDELAGKGGRAPSCRIYKLLELAEDGSSVRLWVSNALDATNDVLWSPRSLYGEVTGAVGPVPPVSLIGGEDDELVREVFLPSWDAYNHWQADALNHLIETQGYEVVFSHLHNVDCAGHQLWHLAKNLPPWQHVDEETYQRFIDEVFVQTDDYIGEFLHLLDEGWTILLVSDHGLLVGENVPPLIGEYGGLNVPVMEELGYTVMKRDAEGNKLREVDWSKTRAVQIRSNYIYLNLKGRDKHGIVEPEDAYELEEQIISDLYNYRDPETGKRVIGIALRNKDAVIIGAGGPEAGDIFFSIEEGHNRLHGDSLTTARGSYETSVTPIFAAAGPGVRQGQTITRTVRQVDVAPTAAVLLGVRFPAQCEGAPLYQLFSEEV